MAMARAFYEDLRSETLVSLELEPPENRLTAEGVASYLRFGGRISDRALRYFAWQGKTFDAMGKELPTSELPTE